MPRPRRQLANAPTAEIKRSRPPARDSTCRGSRLVLEPRGNSCLTENVTNVRGHANGACNQYALAGLHLLCDENPQCLKPALRIEFEPLICVPRTDDAVLQTPSSFMELKDPHPLAIMCPLHPDWTKVLTNRPQAGVDVIDNMSRQLSWVYSTQHEFIPRARNAFNNIPVPARMTRTRVLGWHHLLREYGGYFSSRVFSR